MTEGGAASAACIYAFRLTDGGGLWSAHIDPSDTESGPSVASDVVYVATAQGRGQCRGLQQAVGPLQRVTPTDAPGPPRSITITPGNGHLTLNRQPPASNRGLPITGYRIQPYGGSGSLPDIHLPAR
jgi:hypothetical protein